MNENYYSKHYHVYTLYQEYQTFTDETSSESCKYAYIEETIIKIRCCNPSKPIEKTSIVSYFHHNKFII